MARSYNGWRASRNLRTTIIEPVPGCRLRIVDNPGPIDVFTYLVQQFHARVDDVTKPHPADDWGFNYRPNTNNPKQLSNHASGTAIDLDATEHPNGVATTRTFTPAQIAEVHRILAELDHTVRWGGDYTNTKDAMHFEINVRPGYLRKIGGKIRRGQIPPKKPRFTRRGKNVDHAIRDLQKSSGHGRRAKLLASALKSLRKIRPFY